MSDNADYYMLLSQRLINFLNSIYKPSFKYRNIQIEHDAARPKFAAVIAYDKKGVKADLTRYVSHKGLVLTLLYSAGWLCHADPMVSFIDMNMSLEELDLELSIRGY